MLNQKENPRPPHLFVSNQARISEIWTIQIGLTSKIKKDRSVKIIIGDRGEFHRAGKDQLVRRVMRTTTNTAKFKAVSKPPGASTSQFYAAALTLHHIHGRRLTLHVMFSYEFRIQVSIHRFRATLKAKPGILDPTKRGFGQSKAMMIDGDHAALHSRPERTTRCS